MAESPEVVTPGGSQVTNETVGELKPAERVRFWRSELDKAKKYFGPWWDVSDKIYERYRDERGRNPGTGHRTSEGGRVQTKRFNIFWSNVQTLFPALYSKPPLPVVSRRYKDDDPLARVAVEVSERTLSYQIDPPEQHKSYDSAARCAILDYLLTGRGVTWYSYEKETEETTTALQAEDPETGEMVESVETEERLISERTLKDHVQYRDFVHSIAPTWDEVLSNGWCSRRTFKTRPEVKAWLISKGVSEEKASEKAKKVKLTSSDTVASTGRVARNEHYRKQKEPSYAECWEIWNVPDKMVYHVAEGLDEELFKEPDPLGLTDFFPCPRPLYATTTPDTTVPVPDFVLYYDQMENLDRIVDKKWKLTTALRVAGFYAGKEDLKIQQIFDGTDRNVMVPIQDWAHIQGSGGVKGLIDYIPIDVIITTLQGLEQMEEDNKQQIYEITGIADIIRGQTKASETLGAQRIKGQWASVRLSDRQRQVAAFCRDMLRIDAEIIGEHYANETIYEMTNFANSKWQQIPQYAQAYDAAIQLLRDDKMRNYRVDVETQDTVFADQNQERQQNIDMVTAVGEFVGSAAELVGAVPETLDLAGELLMILVKQFTGTQQRQLEVVVDATVARLKDKAEKAEQTPPQPTPEQIEAEAKAQKDQADVASDQQKNQIAAQGQVLDFRQGQMQLAEEKRKNTLDFISQSQDRLAQTLQRAASSNA